MNTSLIDMISGEENEQLAEQILVYLLQYDAFRNKFMQFLGYKSEKIIDVSNQFVTEDQRHDIVLTCKRKKQINIELKGCAGFTKAQLKSLKNNKNSSPIHHIICPTAKKEKLSSFIQDKRKTKIFTWNELYRFFKNTKYSSFLEGIEDYFYSGETIHTSTILKEIKQYLSNNQNRAWHEVYSFVNNICDKLVTETDNTYSNWSHSKYLIGKYIKKDYYRKSAYVFIGFYFTSPNSIEFFIETDKTYISDQFLDREDEKERVYNYTFWHSKDSTEKYLSSEDIVNKYRKYVTKLSKWRGKK